MRGEVTGKLDIGADPPALAEPRLVDVDPPGRQVLPEEPVGQLPAQTLLPAVQIFPRERVHGLVVAAVVLAVADVVTDQSTAQPGLLGPGCAYLDRSVDRALADPRRLDR